ncbi:MAG: putative metal-dependent hydrolase [Marinoscillum sp.]|uniref:YfiT family bacillithiol transferase n=1 Tax=Marinoscillum sp. TaxID=2024838 RepID=UPI0032FCB1E6
MTPEALEQIKFPVGKFTKPDLLTASQIQNWTSTIRSFPEAVATLTRPLSRTELNWQYRPGGWTIKQVVHHCADSHMNSLMRFKLALTEESPTIRPYHEDRWAELSDSLDDEINNALDLLNGLHGKWVKLISALSSADLQRTFVHPEHGQSFTLAETIGTYDWHCRHHLTHIQLALVHKGSFDL